MKRATKKSFPRRVELVLDNQLLILNKHVQVTTHFGHVVNMNLSNECSLPVKKAGS